ncbi:polyprotein [Phytophthora palmivora]|uniref:Polyprotein n=1 Tax=Phytophthora palmivora TaxID=4796 RepID=A0A2P4XB70_9STRA|nr:polyprotein [Phytophthora palmivora]
MDGFGLGVVPEQTPVSTGGPVAGSSSEAPVGVPMATAQLSPAKCEGVVASGESIERAESSVGETISLSNSDNDNHDDCEEGASFRRTTRIRRPNVRLCDYEVDLPESLVIQEMNAVMESTSVKAAMEAADSEKRIEALNNECSELLRNKTWELVEKPGGVKMLTSKWVFVRKRNAQGQVERHRARITVKGCQQKFGLNFCGTYAPVVCMEAVRLVLLLALHYGLFCRHGDFVATFLNDPIDVEIYMSQPEFFDDGTGRVCRFLRSLYGLKQHPRIWYQTLNKYLNNVDLSGQDGWWCLLRWVDGSPIFLIIYVDDIVIAATMENIKLVLTELGRAFKIKDLGDVSHLLAMEITYVSGISISISQRQLLERFKMASCKAVSTPQVKGNFLCPGGPDRETVCVNIDPDVDPPVPDITNAVRTLGKFLTCYTKEHFVFAKRVLRYLQGTCDFGLVWYKSETPGLQLGNEKDDRRSITDYVLQLIGYTFAYKSKKQPIMTDDTAVLSLWLPVSVPT